MGTNNTANNTPVHNRYSYVTGYNRWRLIPVYEAALITLEPDNVYSPNYIYHSEEYMKDETGYNVNGWTTPKSNIINGFVTKDIYMYYNNIEIHATAEDDDFALTWLSTFVHELGHSLGLGHIPGEHIDNISATLKANNPNLYDSVMVYRDKMSEVVAPHEAEFAGVKKAYYGPH